jgi:hypothetical protein
VIIILAVPLKSTVASAVVIVGVVGMTNSPSVVPSWMARIRCAERRSSATRTFESRFEVVDFGSLVNSDEVGHALSIDLAGQKSRSTRLREYGLE